MPYAVNNGVRIHYQIEGSGPPLLLHIGLMGSLQCWRQSGYVDALRDDYQLIMIDPRGHGVSDKPHDVESYAMSSFVGDMIAVLDAAGAARTHFLGDSMGGAIGFAAGVYAPERFMSLALGGANPYYHETRTEDMAAIRARAEILRQGIELYLDRVEQHYGALPPGVRELWLGNDGNAIAASWLAFEHWLDISEEVSKVSLPTMIYCGTEDEGNYEPARRASEAMPNTRFVSLDGLDHLQCFFRSDLVLPHVRAFLKEVGG
jgi:pimeloyl-ACP methyl ester carboxylesterase